MSATFAEYTIYLDDKAEVARLQAAQSRWNSPRTLGGTLAPYNIPGFGTPVGGVGRLFCSPERALLEFPGAVIRGIGASTPLPSPPYITSPHIYDGAAQRYPTNVDFFYRPLGEAFGLTIHIPFSQLFVWVGKYAWGPPAAVVPTVPGALEPIRQLRWAEGFGLPDGGSGGDSGSRMRGVSPQGSRTHGGYGMIVCDEATNAYVFHDNQEFRGTAYKPTGSWERLYLRIDTLPTSTLYFWSWLNSAGNSALVLAVTTTGNIAVYNQTGASTFVLLGSTAVQPNGTNSRWLKVDLIASIVGSAQIFINGTQVLEIASFPDAGWGDLLDGALVATYHTGSRLGKIVTDGASIGGCLRFADWTSHDIPVTVGLANSDWRNGTKVVRLDPIEYGVDHNAAVWSGVLERFKPLPAISGDLDNYQTSNNATGPKFSVLLDVEDKVTNDPQAINGGLIAAFFGLFHANAAGATAGTIDYSIDGAAFVTKAETLPGGSTTLLSWAASSAAYIPTGLVEPKRIESLAMRFTPGASAHNRTIGAIGGVAVLVGVFGDEDIDPTEEEEVVVPPVQGQHNHWYPRSPWATQEFPPLMPVGTKGGTYVGTGTVTTLTFKVPVIFFKVRRVDALIADGVTWWGSMVGAAKGQMKQMSVEGMLRTEYKLSATPPAVGVDAPDVDTVITIVGNDPASNEAGVTYQYLAFMDPGARFSLAGSLRHYVGTTTRVNPLDVEDWTPIAGMFMKPSTAVAVTNGGFYKGPGHAAESISRTDSAETGSALAFGASALTSKSAFHVGVTEPAINYLLFRLDDGSDDPGIPATIQINTYTGDGGASRTLGLIPTGKRPMWAMVVPHNAAAVFRDPSHLGTTSSVITNGAGLTPNASTGIVGGGIDQMLIGSTLNANGIVYDYIVFMGEATACNGGWSCNVEVFPISPFPPITVPPWTPPPECEFEDDELCGTSTVPPIVTPPPGGGGPGTPVECPTISIFVCNKALSRIGVTDPIIDLEDDTTIAAAQCRLFYNDAVQSVLQRHPWKFATRYAELELVDGTEDTPVNGDWQYSYRLPADLVHARRLIDSEIGRDNVGNPDSEPIVFETTSEINDDDEVEGLLYTNRALDDGIELEYTAQLDCSALAGGALFREALEWKLAAELAPAIARNDVTAEKAMLMFEHIIGKAKLADVQQQQRNTEAGDADWISGR